MKQILSMIALAALGSAAMAQDIKIAPEIGATINTMSQTIEGTDYNTTYQLGFRAGAVMEYQFTQNFSLEPGVFVSFNNGTESNHTRNYSTEAGVPASSIDRRNYSVTYLQVPVYALFKTGVEYDDPHFFFGIGPSFNLGIGGRFRQDYSTTLNGIGRPQKYDDAIDFGDSRTKDQIRRFDISANATIGYELPMGLFFRAYYGVGLLNVAPGSEHDNSFRNSGGGISIGFLINTTNHPRY